MFSKRLLEFYTYLDRAALIKHKKGDRVLLRLKTGNEWGTITKLVLPNFKVELDNSGSEIVIPRDSVIEGMDGRYNSI